MRTPLRTIAFAVAAGLVATSGIALAQPGGGRGGAPITREAVLQRADQQFARMDADRDGRVTAAEMRAAMQARRTDRRARMFDRLDANRDGQISREEFGRAGAMRGARRGGAERRDMRLAGEDGVITRDEFRARALQRFDRTDLNRDGTVAREERREARQRLRSELRARMQGRD